MIRLDLADCLRRGSAQLDAPVTRRGRALLVAAQRPATALRLQLMCLGSLGRA